MTVASAVAVVGAGVVGMACARALQRAGRQVVVVDPEPPGAGCSHGNAGVIAVDHVLPLARPEVMRGLPAMLGDPERPLYLKLSRVPGLAPWLLRMAWASRPASVERGSVALANLVSGAVDAWREELDSCGAQSFSSPAGATSPTKPHGITRKARRSVASCASAASRRRICTDAR